MPDAPDPVALAPTAHDFARRAFHATLTPALSHGYSFYDAIVDRLYAGGEDEDDARFRKKVQRKKPAAPQDGSPL